MEEIVSSDQLFGKSEIVSTATLMGSGDVVSSSSLFKPEFEEMPFAGKHPNLYAAGKTAMDMIPYLKYVDPEERDRFQKLATNEQTRELLYENLNAIATVALPAYGKAAGKIIAPLVERFLPKTFKFWTKEIKLGKGKITPEEINPEPPAKVVPSEVKPAVDVAPEIKTTAELMGEKPASPEKVRVADQQVTETAKLADQNLETVDLRAKVEPPTGEIVQPKAIVDHPEMSPFEYHDFLMDSQPELFKTMNESAKAIGQDTTVLTERYRRGGKEIVQPGATSGVSPSELVKPPLPETSALRIQEQKAVVEKIIKEGIIDKDKPIVFDETQRAMYNIADTIRQYPSYADEILTRYNITADQLADKILEAGTFHGKGLNEFSQWARAMKKAFPKDEYVQEVLGKTIDKELPQTVWGKAADLFRSVDNTRRALMVSQLATAARNVASQTGRSAIGLLDDAIQGTINVGRNQKPSEAYADFLGDFTALWDRMTPSGREKVADLLTKYPMDKAKLLGEPVTDIVAGGKISRVAMFFNKMQEDFFRKMAFDARITSGMKKRGLDIAKDEIPQDVMEQSIQHSLEMTFADNARTEMGKNFLKAWKDFQPVATLIQPFPRFWINSLKFLWDFNPTGLLSAGYQATIAKNPEAAVKAVSRSMVGGLMLGGAMAVRSDPEIAGERYYEIRKGKGEDGKDEYVDLRAFAPFSTYLYFAEQILHPENIKPMDRVQAIVGINRISGTGLTLVDLMRSQRPETATKIMQEVVGQYLGAFTVPGRTVKDIAGGLGAEKETEVSYTRENPVIGPVIQNIPGAGGLLPKSPKLTEGAVYEREKPILRQLTGLTIKSKSELEKEIDRLGIEGVFPRSGDPKLDRLIIEKAGPIVGTVIVDKVLNSSRYEKSDDDTKKFMLEKSIGEVRNQAKKTIIVPHIIDAMKKEKDPAAYLKDLVKRNRIGQAELAGIFANNRNALTPDQWRETMKLVFIKK